MMTLRTLVAGLIVLGTAISAAAPVYAAEPAAQCKKPRRDAGLVSENLYRQLEQATDLIGKSKNAEAIEKMNKMVERASGYEKALILYNMGFAYSAMNKLGDALRVFQQALDSHTMPIPQEEQLQFSVGQLYVVNGQFDKGIDTLESYINESCSPVQAEAHIFLANAYSEKKNFPAALKQVDLAIAKSKAPKETWLQLKLALHYELKQMSACAETLFQLIALAPGKPDYWKQLSGILFDLKKDGDSLAVLALADRQGFLKTGNEVKNLANVYMLLEIPYKAGMLMQTALDKNLLPADEKNLELLSSAWINAHDNARAESSLKKLAAIADKGDYALRLGYIYIDSERWKEAVGALEKAAAKGVKKPGEAAILLAKAHYELGNKRKSAQAAQTALRYDDTRKAASDWLGYLRQETGEDFAAVAVRGAEDSAKTAGTDAAAATEETKAAAAAAKDAAEAIKQVPQPPIPPIPPVPPSKK
jgi:tetratricopeptide (TPR) repeat protein